MIRFIKYYRVNGESYTSFNFLGNKNTKSSVDYIENDMNKNE